MRLRPISGEASVIQLGEIHESDCGCCAGVGNWVRQDVVCERAGSTTVEMFKYDMCGCVTCESVESLPPEALAVPTISGGAVPNFPGI